MSKAALVVDPEVAEFEAALLRSVEQAGLGLGRVSTPEQIAARRGRPPGSTKPSPKVATTIRFDRDVIDGLKATGRGWQTRVNDAMREWLKTQSGT
jgi:uncharacterized protein (DUF4415 family)